MAFTFTPELLQKGLTALGVAAGQLKHFEPATKLAVGRFLVRAFASGNANAFIQEQLGYLERRDEEPPPPARAVKVTATFVEEDDPDQPARPCPPRPRTRR